MNIYPSQDKTGEFEIHLSTQEMINLLDAISNHWIKDFPWGKWAIDSITKSLSDNREYRNKSW